MEYITGLYIILVNNLRDNNFSNSVYDTGYSFIWSAIPAFYLQTNFANLILVTADKKWKLSRSMKRCQVIDPGIMLILTILYPWIENIVFINTVWTETLTSVKI